MRLSAYLLAADPAHLEKSVASYYSVVEKIIVSYDENAQSWTGEPIPVRTCLARLSAIDTAGKMRFVPGSYFRPQHSPIENDTFQRQCAFDLASEGADWVLQLDTDEALPDLPEFMACLSEANRLGFEGMEYPARWLYCQVGKTGKNHYLEACGRFWQIAAGYPGPVVVRPGAQFLCARQCHSALYRVDFSRRNTDPWHAASVPVHRVIRADQGIHHYAWVREADQLASKAKSSGHAYELDWQTELRDWEWCGHHPLLAALRTPFLRRKHRRQLRLVRLPALTMQPEEASYSPDNESNTRPSGHNRRPFRDSSPTPEERE